MKKTLSIVLSLVLLLSLTACGNSATPSSSQESAPGESSEISSAAEVKATPELEPTPEPTSEIDPRIEQMENAVLQYPGQNDEWKYNVYDCYVELTDYIGPIVEILNVPREIEGLPVWKYNLTWLDYINFNDTYYIQNLEDSDIEELKGYKDNDWLRPYQKLLASQELTTVQLPDTLMWIAPYAFTANTNLSTINLPDGLYYIGEYAFSRCDSLTYIKLPNSITNIENGTYCKSGIEKITFSDNLTYIGRAAFADCPISEIIFPESLRQIDQLAFYCCPLLTSATIPASVESISASSFFGCGFKTNEENKISFEITIPGDTVILNDNAKTNRVSTFTPGKYDFTIVRACAGSPAAQYCAEYDIPFEVIKD